MANFEDMQKRPLAIVGAMGIETDVLEEALEEKRTTPVGRYRFVQGTLCGMGVVLARCYIGMTNAAAATALAIAQYRPWCVISEGTAGAHTADLHRSDIVLGRRAKHIHFFATPGKAVGEGSDALLWEHIGPEVVDESGSPRQLNSLEGDAGLLQAALSTPYDAGSVVAGTVGSGDVWNREADRIHALRETMETDCEDMESFAVTQVCHHLDVPSLCIRVISNNELLGEEFEEESARDCQRFVISFVERLAGKNQTGAQSLLG